MKYTEMEETKNIKTPENKQTNLKSFIPLIGSGLGATMFSKNANANSV